MLSLQKNNLISALLYAIQIVHLDNNALHFAIEIFLNTCQKRVYVNPGRQVLSLDFWFARI